MILSAERFSKVASSIYAVFVNIHVSPRHIFTNFLWGLNSTLMSSIIAFFGYLWYRPKILNRLCSVQPLTRVGKWSPFKTALSTPPERMFHSFWLSRHNNTILFSVLKGEWLIVILTSFQKRGDEIKVKQPPNTSFLRVGQLSACNPHVFGLYRNHVERVGRIVIIRAIPKTGKLIYFHPDKCTTTSSIFSLCYFCKTFKIHMK